MWFNDTILIYLEVEGPVVELLLLLARQLKTAFKHLQAWHRVGGNNLECCSLFVTSTTDRCFHMGVGSRSAVFWAAKLLFFTVILGHLQLCLFKNRYFWQELSSRVCANKTGCFLTRPQDTLQPCLWCQKWGCIQMLLWRHKWVLQATAGTFASLA